LKALLNKAPVVAYVDGSNFSGYKGGIFKPNDGCGTESNLYVLVVGYSVAYEINQTYFIIKNSWGSKWGDHGFALIAADPDNTCGIFNDIV